MRTGGIARKLSERNGKMMNQTKKHTTGKKLLALLLALVMMLSLLPTSVLATGSSAEETIYVLAGGDFQEAGDHANSAANVTNILAQVNQKYSTMNGFLFVGDYDCDTHNDANATADGITALMGAVQGTYSNLNDANSILAQGNHDYKDSRIDATGGHDMDVNGDGTYDYSAYVLNEDDYPNGGGSQKGIQTLANNLKTWLNNKIGEGYSAPIFIVSHLPLAYTPRTVTQGDAKYAKYVFDVLNDAGKNGLNIIFLHGHDHAFGPDNYMGGEAIYLPVGDKICIAEAGSTNAWTEETLNFTYMNAGYTGYYSDPYTYNTTAGTDKLTMTVFAITGTEVTVERYSANGLYNLKSAGYDGSYNNTSVTNTSLGLPKYSTVYTSPQTIALVDNGAADMGTIGQWVGVTAESTDDVTTSNKGWVEITAPSSGTVFRLTDTLVAGKKYVIVNSNTAGSGAAVNLSSSSIASTPVTVIADPNGNPNDNYIEAPATSAQWTYTANRYFQSVSSENSYLRGRKTTGALRVGDTSDSYITWNYSSKYGLYGNDNKYSVNKLFALANRSESNRVFIYVEEAKPATDGTYYEIKGELSYTVSSTTTDEQAMALVKGGIDGYIYEAMSAPSSDVAGTKVDDGALKWEWADAYQMGVPGDYAIKISYTYNGADYELGTAEVVVPASTTYYAAEGNGLYLVDMNTTAEKAMAAVKDGVTVYSATDASGSNKTAIGDDEVTWEWVDKYNGADSGPYTVEILKNGTSLGTVEVKVNIKYETGLKTGWTYIGETEATGGQYTYTLDTDGIEYGEENKYIIVDDNEAIVLNANSSSNGTAHSITISGNTATVDTRDYEYHFIQTSFNGKRYELITKGDGSQYLYQQDSGVRYGTRDSVKFQVNHHGNGVYDIHDIDGANWYIIYNGGWTVTQTTSARVRLYKYTGTTGGTPAGSVYALIEGNTVYTVTQGSSATKALAAVKAGITGFTATDANGNGKTEIADSDLTWKWKNTFNGNSTGSYWVEISYQGKVLGTVEVKVEPGVVNNYPEYPDEGSVKVNKTGTGIDFQSSGIAQVELSASGVPIKKGADVIVMLDTSSSMTTHKVTGTNQTRAQVLEESLKNLIAQFKTPGADGQLLDIRVAIADFNGFYGENHNASGTAYDRDAADMMSDDISYNANSEARVYTGDGTLGAGAFIPVEDLAASYTLNYTSGTNYDYAFDAIYQMGTAIKEASGSEDRDLYVIFMSDGAAMQWNYYHSQGRSSLWNNWITGAWDAADLTSNLNCTEHAYYYDEVDHNGDGMRNEHRMANAIKGDPAEQFEVIRKTSTLGTPTDETNMYMVPGLGAKMFAISFDAQADTNVTKESMDKSIASLASEQKYYYKVTTADELTNAFAAIGSEIAYAAYNARFVDQMGDDYNLQMAVRNYDVVDGSSTTEKTITPKIEIISYDIYQASEVGTEVGGVLVTSDMVGNRKGTYTVLETVTFNDAGTEAYSDQIGENINILADGSQAGRVKGVIYAKYFIYNTNANSVAVDGVNIPTGTKADGTTTGSTNMLPSETFYWKMGTVQTSELAMRYYVYLTGSMEGTREAGSYPTNESATLYYTNWLGNEAKKDTVSPVLAWKSANVSYAFYLVDENGKIIVNKTTGQTGSFANKVAVTNPVVFSEVLLNSTENVQAKILASGVLPEGYALYDTEAAYNVRINSNSTGGWTIKKGTDPATTYVTEYGGNPTTELEATENSYDYTHTVVWFAVKYQISCVPDAVVIDFGLPVDISVLANDILGEGAAVVGLAAVGSIPAEQGTATPATGFSTDKYNGTYGTATINGTKVRYTPKDMQMNGAEKFAYAAKANLANDQKYYYSTVTVIPAANIYYEDSFVKTSNSSAADGTYGVWTPVGTTDSKTQAEDRPGTASVLADANNLYGYDAAYANFTLFSLGSAKKVTVNAATGTPTTAPTASFTFTGTGFDIISLTDNKSGTIVVTVRNTATNETKNYSVNNYFGYTYSDGGGTWKPTDSANPNALYQVPVIKVEDLAYGTYDVTIKVAYLKSLDQHSTGKCSFWLDAVRIYDPAMDDETAKEAYLADKESSPDYAEVRNLLIAGNSFAVNNDAGVTGAVFIDGIASDATIQQFTAFGPNNEAYLANNQAIAFQLVANRVPESVQLGAKLAVGGSATLRFNDKELKTLSTATDMYYALSGLNWTKDETNDIYTSDVVVLQHKGVDGIISLTNIKITGGAEFIETSADPLNEVKLAKEPVVMALASPQMAARALKMVAVYEEPAPEILSVVADSAEVMVGDTVKLTVTTNADTDYILVNAAAVETYTEDEAGNRVWTYEAKAEEPGEVSFTVTAMSADGHESEESTCTVDVQQPAKPANDIAAMVKKAMNAFRKIFDAIFGWRR